MPAGATPATAPSPWAARVPLALLGSAAFVLGAFELADTDLWWHLKTGQLIPTQGLPKKDWYTYMSAERPWIDVHWGFQRLLAMVHGQWGAAGLVAMKATLGCLAFLLAQLAYRREWPAAPRVWAWIPALLLMSARFYERPESVTLVFEALFLAVLFHAEERPRLLWLLPIAQAAWANVQGLYVFGPALLAMYWCEALLRMNRTQGLFRHLIPVTVLVFLACLASPYKLDNPLLVLQILQTATGADYRDTIAELKPVRDFIADGAWRTNGYLWLLLGLLAAGTLSILASWRTWLLEGRVFRVLPFVAFSYVGLQALRNGNHFALVAGCTIAWSLGSLRWRPRGWRPAFLATLAAAATLWAAASDHWHRFVSPQRWLGFAERPHYYPHEAMRFAARDGMPDRALLFHNGCAPLYTYWAYSPERPRLIHSDARLEVMDISVYRQYGQMEKSIQAGDGAWEGEAARQGVGLVGADSENGFQLQGALLANPRWRCVWFDEIYALFMPLERGTPAPAMDFAAWAWADSAPIADLPPKPPGAPWWWLRPPPNARPNADDALAARLPATLATMESLGGIDQTIAAALRVRGVRAAHAAAARRPWALEAHRHLGAAANAWAPMPPTLTAAWHAPKALPAALAVRAFEQARSLAPADLSANHFGGAALHSVGADDLALAALERIPEGGGATRMQQKLQAKDGAAAQLRSKLAASVAAAEQRRKQPRGTFAAVAEAIELRLAGLALGSLLDAVDPATLAPEDYDRAGTWLLALGRADAAAAWYGAKHAAKLPPARLELRNVEAALLAGRFAAARNTLAAWRGGGTDQAEAAWCRAWLALLDGDAAACAEAGKRVDPSDFQPFARLLPAPQGTR